MDESIRFALLLLLLLLLKDYNANDDMCYEMIANDGVSVVVPIIVVLFLYGIVLFSD